MTLPANDLTTFEIIFATGRAVFLLFSFIIAAVTFTAWRRATAHADRAGDFTNKHRTPATGRHRSPRGCDEAHGFRARRAPRAPTRGAHVQAPRPATRWPSGSPRTARRAKTSWPAADFRSRKPSWCGACMVLQARRALSVKHNVIRNCVYFPQRTLKGRRAKADTEGAADLMPFGFHCHEQT